MHIVGYFLTLIVMAVMTKEKHDAKFVFATFINSSGWSSDGVSFCIGLLTSVYGFGGIDTAAHFSEEIKNVRRSVPRASESTSICLWFSANSTSRLDSRSKCNHHVALAHHLTVLSGRPGKCPRLASRAVEPNHCGKSASASFKHAT